MLKTASKTAYIRNQSIDLIKIIAMFGVISLHCNMDRLDNPVAFLLSRIAGISIPLFFMVSGYLLINKECSISYITKKIIGIVRYVLICSIAFGLIHTIHHRQLDTSSFTVFIKSFINKGPLWMFWYFGAMCILYALLPLLKWADNHIVYFFPKLILILISIDFCVFIATYTSLWEYNTIQTFRLWNWLTYFSLGACIRRYHIKTGFGILSVVIPMSAFVAFVFYSQNTIDGIEYFFTTPLCQLYAVMLFLYIESLPISDNKVIADCSQLFLVVYTIHCFIIIAYHKQVGTAFPTLLLSPFLDYIFICLITVALSILIMRLPLADKIFRI